MIHELGVELQAALVALGCPLPVVDGPENTKSTTYARERIVLEHDEKGDSFGPVRTQHRNPKSRMTRIMGVKATIYAKHPYAGALEFEHRRRANHALDLVLVALGNAAAARHNVYTPTAGRFITPEDLAGSERVQGAAYELTFTIDRAVEARTWAGAAGEEVTVIEGMITSTTKVSGNAADDDDNPYNVPASAETACGA